MQKCSELLGTINKTSVTVAELNKKLEQQKKQSDILTNTNASLLKEINTLKVERDTQIQKSEQTNQLMINELTAKYNAKSEEYNKLLSEYNQNQKTIEKLVSEKESKESKESKEAKEAKEAKKPENTKQQAPESVTYDEYNDLIMQYDVLHTCKLELSRNMAILIKTYDSEKSILVEKEEQVMQYEKRVSKMQNDSTKRIKDLNDKVNELTSKLGDKDLEIKRLIDKVEKDNTMIIASKQMEMKLNNSIFNLESKISTYKSKYKLN